MGLLSSSGHRSTSSTRGSGHGGRWLPKRVSPQMIAFALLLVSTVNLMVAVVPNAGDDGDGGDGGGDDGGGGGGVNVNVNVDDGLGELGESVAVDDGNGNRHAPISCSSLPIEEADECLRERDRRIAEREARRKKEKGGGGGGGAMTKAEKEAALEAYKKRVRREKALKFKQRDDEGTNSRDTRNSRRDRKKRRGHRRERRQGLPTAAAAAAAAVEVVVELVTAEVETARAARTVAAAAGPGAGARQG